MWLGLFAWTWLVSATVGTASAETLPLLVPQDTAVLLDLGQPAGQVHVANPEIADVSAVLSTRMVVLGKSLGQTNILVLNANQELILDRVVLVVPQEHYAVTVNRGVVESGYSCSPRCVQVSGPAPGQGSGGAAGPAAALTGGATPAGAGAAAGAPTAPTGSPSPADALGNLQSIPVAPRP